MTTPRKPREPSADRLERPAFGLEAELNLLLDDVRVDPATVFRDPTGFIPDPLMHRTGTSYHLPNGAAVYFDTGVIEIATPAMELERGCVSRAARSLWEGIDFVRDRLDAWDAAHGRRTRLQGFSTHYNVSVADAGQRPAPSTERLAHALVYVLPAPVMLLATNRRSTGVGVRPRIGRIEVTADFTPDPLLMIAAGSVVAGIVRDMRTWSTPALSRVSREVPIIEPFAPVRHTSRRGWLAHVDCYAESPFACSVDAPRWHTSRGRLSLRVIAQAVVGRFEPAIAAIADPAALRAIRTTLARPDVTLLSLDDRPASYDDVGRSDAWRSDALKRIQRSRYERVVRCAVRRQPLEMRGRRCTPVAVRGWSRVVFRRDGDGARLALSFDELVPRLSEWEQTAVQGRHR
jgi:hypothetical protein